MPIFPSKYMGLFERTSRNEPKWIWFIGTVIASFIPVALRFITSMDYNVNPIDIKDFLFAGLGLSLSNLNLIGHKKFDQKTVIALFSAGAIVFIAYALGVYLRNEADIDTVKKEPFWLSFFSYGITFASIYLSYEANHYVFKKTPRK
jgi:hypothetical protein